MTDSKHTPGPWNTGENGSIVCYPVGLAVSVLSKQLPDDEREANRCLIVASPELLAAVKRLVGDKIISGMYRVEMDDLRFAHAAIAKAEGRSSQEGK